MSRLRPFVDDFVRDLAFLRVAVTGKEKDEGAIDERLSSLRQHWSLMGPGDRAQIRKWFKNRFPRERFPI